MLKIINPVGFEKVKRYAPTIKVVDLAIFSRHTLPNLRPRVRSLVIVYGLHKVLYLLFCTELIKDIMDHGNFIHCADTASVILRVIHTDGVV